MTTHSRSFGPTAVTALSLLAWQYGEWLASANPVVGGVARGAAAVSSSGSQLTVNVSTPNAVINWQSFNIGAGETTTFVQPSASSVVWNNIADANPSQILGTLNANGYVILQNQYGFNVGGSAAINAHGLILTTSSAPPPDLSSSGPWVFNAPALAAKIVNYGQINIAGGGSAFLIANDIENKGTISAPGGKIGLYAGEQVLVSLSPDGLALSAPVTLPQGSVDNTGKLIADAGTIAAQAQTVNQNGLVQANSVQNVNGVIEFVASDSVTLGANSQVSAQGGAQGVSPGGAVIIKSGNTFSDQPGSLINVSGGAQGGRGGSVEISAAQPDAIQSTINGRAAAGFTAGMLTLDPTDITIDAPYAASLNSLISGGLSQITVQADNDIDVTALWTLTGTTPGIVSLTAGNNITLDPGAGIVTGNYWGVNLTAGNTIQLNQNSQIQANGGNITLKAANVNQNGLLKAGSVGTANGVVEIDASSTISLGSASDIEVAGDGSASPGGMVVLQAGGAFNDQAGSKINVAGTSGAADGVAELFGNNLTDATSVQSLIDGVSAAQFGAQNILLLNPYDLTVSANPTTTASSPPTATAPAVPANLNISDLANYSQIDLRALDDIELQTAWTLADPGAPASLSLGAGNRLVLDNYSGIYAGNNWSVNLMAGTGFASTPSQPAPAPGSDGIYLNGSSAVQTRNGDISLWAANEVQIDADVDAAGNNGIRTLAGGNIGVTTVYGDVNTGGNPQGYNYQKRAPYATPSIVLGGISTVAGGNVAINAGGNVFSFLPTGSMSDGDGGTGAFGPEPGNVTITAGDGIYGHYVLANGVGTITAGTTVGDPIGANPFALSLIDGSWNVNAPQGGIYLQEVRNPNGVFNTTGNDNSAASHLFNYGPQATVNLTAALGVYLTGVVADLPRPLAGGQLDEVQVIYPPILNISAGAGGVNLLGSVTLFPSADQNLSITTTGGGSLTATLDQAEPIELLLSDSSQTRWNFNINTGITAFSDADNGTGIPVQAANPNPVLLTISGSMENLNLITSKATDLAVAGNMENCGFSGQNLHAGDVTTLTVGGQIENPSSYSSVTLSQAIPGVPANDLPTGLSSSWNTIFALAVNPALLPSPAETATISPAQLALNLLESASVYRDNSLNGLPSPTAAPNFFYDAATGLLALKGPMDATTFAEFGTAGQPVYILHLVNGQPVVGANGQFELDTVNWAPASAVDTLYAGSQGAANTGTPSLGYRLGGPGQFDINAGSISLGDSSGILSCGVTDPTGGFDRYTDLAALTPVGATVKVTVAGDLTMLTSTIAALGGGDVNVTSTGGTLDLGLQELSPALQQVGPGIFTSGPGHVSVTAFGNVNIDGSRIATFDGGNITVESQTGTVNVGSGGDTYNGVYVSYVDPAGNANFYAEYVYGSGIVANTLVTPGPTAAYATPGSEWPPHHASAPGNITVDAPRGDITASLGGITQEALDGNTATGPTITLTAGTPASATSPGYSGNIDLGQSGVIGGTVNLTANGNITGLIISRQNSTVNAAQNVGVSVISGGTADVSGGGSVSGVIVGAGGVSVSGGSVTATALGQNVSVNGGASQSTLGSSATATGAAQSAANQADAQAREQLANNDGNTEDPNKKQKPLPVIRRVKRVTVILPDQT